MTRTRTGQYHSNIILLAVVVLLLLLLMQVCTTQQVETIAALKRIDFNFPTQQQHEQYIKEQHYKDCVIAGIKLDSSNQIYVSLPRWKNNCPVTLAKFNVTTGLLDAYPSWEWNTQLDNVTHGLQSVLGFEIDSEDKMWILDQGKMFGQEAQNGSIKLIIWNIKDNEEEGRRHFTEEEAPLRTSFLNDIVVSTSDNVAYISDSGLSVNASEPMTPAIIYYDVGDNVVKRMLANTVSTNADGNVTFSVNGKMCLGADNPMMTGADGIALTCDGQRLYWTPLTSRRLYAIDTDVLQMYDADDGIVEKAVIDLGDKKSVSDGLACSSRHDLFITALEDDTIYQVSEKILAPYVAESENAKITKRLAEGRLSTLMRITANNSMISSTDGTTTASSRKMVWPDTMAFSSDHYLYFVSNNLCAFMTDSIDYDSNEPQFLIYRVLMSNKAKSYVHGCEYEKTQLRFIEWFLIIVGICLFVGGLTVIIIYTIRKNRIEYKRLQEERKFQQRQHH